MTKSDHLDMTACCFARLGINSLYAVRNNVFIFVVFLNCKERNDGDFNFSSCPNDKKIAHNNLGKHIRWQVCQYKQKFLKHSTKMRFVPTLLIDMTSGMPNKGVIWGNYNSPQFWHRFHSCNPPNILLFIKRKLEKILVFTRLILRDYK